MKKVEGTSAIGRNDFNKRLAERRLDQCIDSDALRQVLLHPGGEFRNESRVESDKGRTGHGGG
jgi:hypothetical protein